LLIQNFEKFAYLLNCVLNIKHKYLTFLGNWFFDQYSFADHSSWKAVSNSSPYYFFQIF
jgi:hypothetical protein